MGEAPYPHSETYLFFYLKVHKIVTEMATGKYSLGFMAFGAVEGPFPQPVEAPVSSASPHPGLVSFGSPQAAVPLSGAGGVLLFQTSYRKSFHYALLMN